MIHFVIDSPSAGSQSAFFFFQYVLKIKLQKIFLACQRNALNEFSGSYINLDSLGEGSNWKQDVERFFLTLQST